jgi:hypothetical protein
LDEEGEEMKQSSGEVSRENAKVRLRVEMGVGNERRYDALRHCERSEAIQTVAAERLWIASLRSQ